MITNDNNGSIFAGILIPSGTNHRELVETIKAALPLDKRHLVQSYYLAPGDEKALSILVDDDRPEVDFLQAVDSGFITRTQLIALIERIQSLMTKNELSSSNLMEDETVREIARASADAYGFCIILLQRIIPSPPILDPSPQNLVDFGRVEKSELLYVIDLLAELFDASTARSRDSENDVHTKRRAQASVDAYAECLLQLRQITG